MDLEQRIERLEKEIAEQKVQRDWLLSVNWSSNGATAQEAASHHDEVIATYLFLIERLRERQ